MLTRLMTLWLNFAFLGVLSGCIFQTQNERVAGGAEDFPNTVAMGAAVAGGITDQSEWDQFSTLPSTLPSIQAADSLRVAPDSLSYSHLKPGAALPLPKTTALGIGDTVTWDFSDTLSRNIVRRFHTQVSLGKIRHDTTVFRFDAKAIDSLIGNELILESRGSDVQKFLGRVSTYKYENLDSSGGFDRAIFTDSRTSLETGSGVLSPLTTSIKTKKIVVLAGPDGDINTRVDNIPVSYEFNSVKTVPGEMPDTTEFFEIKDADGDGTLWGLGDSGLVDFKQKIPNPIFRPAVSLITQKIKAVLYKDEQKSYPISFVETRTEKDGKVVTFSVKGIHPDSVFSPGDTAWVNVHVLFPASDLKLEKQNRYKIVLGDQPKHYQDNKLILYHSHTSWKSDSILTATFSIKPDHPVVSKELSWTGDIQADMEFSNGDTVLATGRFQDKKIDLDVTRTKKDGQIRHRHIRWDAVGKFLNQTIIN